LEDPGAAAGGGELRGGLGDHAGQQEEAARRLDQVRAAVTGLRLALRREKKAALQRIMEENRVS
jgi:hypothetical protein